MNKSQSKAKEDRRETRHFLKQRFGDYWYDYGISHGYIKRNNRHDKWEKDMIAKFDKLLGNKSDSKTGGWS